MALKIKPKGDKKITIYGTDIELPEVLGRIVFNAHDNGRTVDAAVNIYANQGTANNGVMLPTNLGIITFPRFDVNPELGEQQDCATILQYAKNFIETELGYEVEIL